MKIETTAAPVPPEVLQEIARPEIPEHKKLQARRTETAIIARFLDFIEGYGYRLCVWDKGDQEAKLPAQYSDEVNEEEIMRAYLGIDEAAYQAEVQALAAYVKEVHKSVHGSTPGGVFVGSGKQ